MPTEATSLIATLSLAMVITSLAAVESRNLRVATYAYLLQALLLVGIFLGVAITLHNEWLLVWAAVALITKATIIPYLLFAYLRRLRPLETRPWIDFAPSVILAMVLMIVFYRLVHVYANFLAPTPLAAMEPYRTSLAVALTVFALGLYAMASRRDAFKTVIALCLLENGVHLSLVSLAPRMPETAIVGIVTEVFVAVWMLLYVIQGVYESLGTTDSADLNTLKG